MATALLQGAAPNEVLPLASRCLKASREKLFDALPGALTDSHRSVPVELMRHIEDLESRITRFDARLLEGLRDEHNRLVLLQTLPGIDLIGAAMLLVEIGNDMSVFGRADRLSSWVGICPGNHESAGKRQSGRQERQSLCPPSAVRVRPCRKPYPMRRAVELPGPDRTPRT